MLLSLAFAIIISPLVLLSRATPLNRDHDNGILYRFSPASSNETEGLLSWAEQREWDLWQMSHSHIDVYFPHRAIAEAELGILPFPLPPSTSHSIDREGVRTVMGIGAGMGSRSSTPWSRSHDHHHDDSRTMRHTTPGSWDVSSPSNATFHARYHPLDEIESFVRDLAAAYPRQVSVVRLGHSGEGREMFALKIVSSEPESESESESESAPAAAAAAPYDYDNDGDGDAALDDSTGLGYDQDHDVSSRDPKSQEVLGIGRKRKGRSALTRCGFLITGAQHAREWVATASALYIAHALLADLSEEFSLAHLLERHNFYIVPVPNPDGYVYSWERDRFWYKNRLQLGPEVRCVGVDMNRNWGYKWKGGSRHQDPCSYWYPGNRPFQAPEVNNMENYFVRLPRLKGFLDLRSYGQMLSTPFSHSCKKSPKDAEDQLEAISGAAHAMKKSHGTLFTTGALCSTLYRAPGNIVDWVYKRMGVKYSFAAHLRDTGTYGFALPEPWIRPVGEETSKMVEYLADFIAKKECH